ncbi:hypothetical protein NFI96_003341 [Prochilodus magdalenae]|nr:hypothetical protein NFI96_003341 [Prochilodus magdalenae]
MERAQSPRPEQSCQSAHEPIRFGIDQILGSSDSAPGSPTGTTAAPLTSLRASRVAVPGSLEGSGLSWSSRAVGHRGVIRVPAHRPLAAAVPAPMVSAAAAAAGGFGALCFPWVDHSRRFSTKDRLTALRGITHNTQAYNTPRPFLMVIPAFPSQHVLVLVVVRLTASVAAGQHVTDLMVTGRAAV